jgi:hypothetical protein
MKKIILLLIVTFSMSSCYVTYRTPYRNNGLRPLWYNPRTHHGPFYKHPKPKNIRPHFQPVHRW